MQRKVKFPNEFDALDIVTDELRKKMQPVARKRIEIEKARDERCKVRKRTRVAVPAARPPGSNAGSGAEANAVAASSGDVEMSEPAAEQPAAGEELQPEEWYREREKTELEALIDPSIKADTGASQTGLYDLVGEFILLYVVINIVS
jgi:ubiquitin carboxyl-terminal hydrolase 14